MRTQTLPVLGLSLWFADVCPLKSCCPHCWLYLGLARHAGGVWSGGHLGSSGKQGASLKTVVLGRAWESEFIPEILAVERSVGDVASGVYCPFLCSEHSK